MLRRIVDVNPPKGEIRLNRNNETVKSSCDVVESIDDGSVQNPIRLSSMRMYHE